ncbi:MAG TPA: TIGR03619 family F420-dependent LLM class oxidoreductase [Candidatus Limnocylindrales bacterium]
MTAEPTKGPLPRVRFDPPGLAIGVAIPHYGLESNAETIEASVETAERLGWSGGAWVQDHLVVEAASRDPYGRVYEALATLAYLAGRTNSIVLGTSVIVPPMRDAILLAKELAAIDALSRGRLIVGAGAGWDLAEFTNLGYADRFAVRGAYLDETIALWRHLWSGSRAPFEGRLLRLGSDYEFGPLPHRPGGPPVWIGGRSAAAYGRAGTIGDAFHSGELMDGPERYAAAVAAVADAAKAAGRPTPPLSARLNIRFGRDHGWRRFTVDGSPAEIAAGLERFRALGLSHVVCNFGIHDPDALERAMERFDAEVVAAVPGAG